MARWLAPAMTTVPNKDAMEGVLRQWIGQCSSLEPPAGRWAIELAGSGELVGGAAILPLPPDGIDLEIGWQLARPFWGRGLATEAGHGAAHYAFTAGVDEVFAVVRPHNTRGIATARRVGMEWVGETDKYYELTLQVYRLREGDLDVPPLLEHHSRTGSE
ncbi:hypothetical protein GCM10022206_54190 [Streptomyces chiangmaiensis]